MDIIFADGNLEKACCEWKGSVRRFGKQRARLVGRRLRELESAGSLRVLMTLPQLRCHELTGSRSGQLAVKLDHQFRLVFEPAHNPIPRKHDGGLDWAQVTAVRILEVVDYHGG